MVQRLSYKTLLWLPDKMNIALDAAKAILSTLEPDHQFVEYDIWEKTGEGYVGLFSDSR